MLNIGHGVKKLFYFISNGSKKVEILHFVKVIKSSIIEVTFQQTYGIVIFTTPHETIELIPQHEF